MAELLLVGALALLAGLACGFVLGLFTAACVNVAQRKRRSLLRQQVDQSINRGASARGRYGDN